MRATCLSHLILLDLINVIVTCEAANHEANSDVIDKYMKYWPFE
jgi:hypothetical protein